MIDPAEVLARFRTAVAQGIQPQVVILPLELADAVLEVLTAAAGTAVLGRSYVETSEELDRQARITAERQRAETHE